MRTKTRGFTLIELLIVIGIIALLATISVMVGQRMVDNGKQNATEGVLRTLDLTLQTYLSDKRVDGVLPATVVVRDAGAAAVATAWPLSDVRGDAGVINSVGMFMYLVQNSSNDAAKAELGHLPTSLTGRLDIDGAAGPQPELMTAFDAWKRPIRFVHPSLDGDFETGNMTSPEFAEITKPNGAQWGTPSIGRKSQVDNADADGGSCDGATPYFYSVGPDGLASSDPAAGDARTDNVYTRQPKFRKRD